MEEYTPQEKQFMLNLARKSIEHHLNTGKRFQISQSEIPSEKLKEKRAAFITLYKMGDLRGCIGSLEPQLPLYKEIIDKSFAAAFQDPRFLPLAKDELSKTKISISILTIPEPLKYKDSEDLLQKLSPGKDGVLIKKGFNSATYLPEVWEELKDKEEFLSNLCLKAGLYPDEWKEGIEVFIYRTIKISE